LKGKRENWELERLKCRHRRREFSKEGLNCKKSRRIRQNSFIKEQKHKGFQEILC